jgi:hypothetical protein
VSEIKRKVFTIVAGKKFYILPLALESLLSLVQLIMDSMEQFQASSFIHITHKSHKPNIHTPKETGATFAGIVIIEGRTEILYSISLLVLTLLNNSHINQRLSVSSVPSNGIHVASCCSY